MKVLLATVAVVATLAIGVSPAVAQPTADDIRATAAAVEATRTPGGTATKARRPFVTVARAQANALRVARLVFLFDARADRFGPGTNADCVRERSWRVRCWGWVRTYREADQLSENPYRCWFAVRTIGQTNRRFTVRPSADSLRCEPA